MAGSEYEMKSTPVLESKKVILLGNMGVGKTSLFRIFAGIPLSSNRGTEGLRQGYHVKDFVGHGVSMWLWDTAGMERLRGSMTNSYYRDSVAAILVFDPTDPESLNDLNGTWLEAVRARENPEQPSQLFLVVTKLDKITELRKRQDQGANVHYVTDAGIDQFVHETGATFSGVYHVSKNDVDSIDRMFDDMALKLKVGKRKSPEKDSFPLTENARAGSSRMQRIKESLKELLRCEI